MEGGRRGNTNNRLPHMWVVWFTGTPPIDLVLRLFPAAAERRKKRASDLSLRRRPHAAASRGSRWPLVARDRARRVLDADRAPRGGHPEECARPARAASIPSPSCVRGVHALHISREKPKYSPCCLSARAPPLLSLAQWLANELETKHYLMAQAHGSHLPMQIRMELETVCQSRRLPGMPTSNVAAECILGRDETIDYEDFLGMPGESETGVDMYAALDRRFNLGPRSSLHGKMAAADGAPPLAVEAPRANVATVKLGMGGL